MKNQRFPLVVAILALGAILLLVRTGVSAMQEPSASSSATQQQDPASPPTAMSKASESQTFTGKVAKSGSKLVLKDTASKATYALDDQDKAKQFEGQTVKVTGTLDSQTNTIRVANIELAS
jgi:hypothetical protein